MTISYSSSAGPTDDPAGLRALLDDPGSLSEEEIRRRLESSPRRVTTSDGGSLTQDEFRALWSALEETGILDISEEARGEPPKDRAYFLFDGTTRRRIIAEPAAPRTGLLDADEVRDVEAWRKAKQVVATGSWRKPKRVPAGGVSGRY